MHSLWGTSLWCVPLFLLACASDKPHSGPTVHSVPTTQERFALGTSLIIPCYYTDFDMLPVVLESVSKQTVMPDETILVLSQDDTDVAGSTLMRFNFPAVNVDNAPQRRDAAIDPTPFQAQPAEVIGGVIKANGQPLELSILRIPNLKVLVRTGTYFAGHNRMYGVDRSRNETDVFFFFDCDDYMHHRRTEYIAKVGQRTALSADAT